MNKIDELKKELSKNIRTEKKMIEHEYNFASDGSYHHMSKERALEYEVDRWKYKIEKSIGYKKFFHPFDFSHDMDYGFVENKDVLMYYYLDINKSHNCKLNNEYLSNNRDNDDEKFIIRNIKIGDFICKITKRYIDNHGNEDENNYFYTLSYLHKEMKKNIKIIEKL